MNILFGCYKGWGSTQGLNFDTTSRTTHWHIRRSGKSFKKNMHNDIAAKGCPMNVGFGGTFKESHGKYMGSFTAYLGINTFFLWKTYCYYLVYKDYDLWL